MGEGTRTITLTTVLTYAPQFSVPWLFGYPFLFVCFYRKYQEKEGDPVNTNENRQRAETARILLI